MSDFELLDNIDGTTLDHIDADGDGADDMASLDTDDDGVAEAVFLDHGRDGSFDHAVLDTDGDGTADLGFEDVDNDGTVDQYSKDTDGDGHAEIMDVRTGNLLLDPSPPAPPPEVTTTVVPGPVETHVEVTERTIVRPAPEPAAPVAEGPSGTEAPVEGPIVLDGSDPASSSSAPAFDASGAPVGPMAGDVPLPLNLVTPPPVDNTDSDGDGVPNRTDSDPYADQYNDNDLDGRADGYDNNDHLDQFNDDDYDGTANGYDSYQYDDNYD
jgi:hypothetical protein